LIPCAINSINDKKASSTGKTQMFKEIELILEPPASGKEYYQKLKLTNRYMLACADCINPITGSSPLLTT
jgi:hypothetical protein|tara:strand:+ start:72 stop:281 length:210 start_codon:yes stop_codon:yes gene_type:complete